MNKRYCIIEKLRYRRRRIIRRNFGAGKAARNDEIGICEKRFGNVEIVRSEK